MLFAAWSKLGRVVNEWNLPVHWNQWCNWNERMAGVIGESGRCTSSARCWPAHLLARWSVDIVSVVGCLSCCVCCCCCCDGDINHCCCWFIFHHIILSWILCGFQAVSAQAFAVLTMSQTSFWTCHFGHQTLEKNPLPIVSG